MNKVLVLAIAILLGWLGKLSYDVMRLNQQHNQLQQNLYQTQQQNANLNDRVVALQRAKEQLPSQLQDSVTTQHLQPITLVQQQLELIEFALKQQQYAYALEKLSHLDQGLKQLGISPSLTAALNKAILKDRQDIQKFVYSRQLQQQQVSQLLQQLDVLLNDEIQKPNLNVAQEQKASFWQQWIHIESARQPAQLLMQRQFVLKEAQLYLLLARQMLLQGQYLAYQQEMDVVLKTLQQLPDQKAQQLRQKIEQAKAMTTLATPVLSTKALLR